MLDPTHFRKEVLPLVTCSGSPGEISTVALSRSCSLFLLDQKTSKAGMQRRSGPPMKIAYVWSHRQCLYSLESMQWLPAHLGFLRSSPVISQPCPACPLCYGPTEFLQLCHRRLRFTYKVVHSSSGPSSFHNSGVDGAFWLFTKKKSKDERLCDLPKHTRLLTPVGCPL